MRKALLLLVFVVAAAPVFAQHELEPRQQPGKDTRRSLCPDAATHDQVMTLLDLLQIRKTMATDDGRNEAGDEAGRRTEASVSEYRTLRRSSLRRCMA